MLPAVAARVKIAAAILTDYRQLVNLKQKANAFAHKHLIFKVILKNHAPRRGVAPRYRSAGRSRGEAMSCFAVSLGAYYARQGYRYAIGVNDFILLFIL